MEDFAEGKKSTNGSECLQAITGAPGNRSHDRSTIVPVPVLVRSYDIVPVYRVRSYIGTNSTNRTIHDGIPGSQDRTNHRPLEVLVPVPVLSTCAKQNYFFSFSSFVKI